MRHFAMALFNRATFGRMSEYLEYMKKDEEVKLTLYLGSTILDEEYGQTKEFIIKAYPHINVVALPYNNYKDDPNRVSKISADILKRFRRCPFKGQTRTPLCCRRSF
jgi:hypothetical protein